ncbi:ATP-binding protein [Streptomyces sp. ODS28]|uniref:ATP-binding protein n=1 Tax=Streptomyces sp. ODS28 TaxID=3136688 RepID=UPI0031E6E505
MADDQEAAITLPSSPGSVTTARRYVTDMLAEWGVPAGGEAVEAVRLIVSELATNAVQHTRGESPEFTVEVRLTRGEELCLGVSDRHPRMPRRLPAAVQQDNGRGMMIVRCLTAEAGGTMTVTPTVDGGKTVWITLPWQPLPVT